MTTPLEDELAAALAQLVKGLNGYKNCPTVLAMADSATAILAKYASAKHEQLALENDATCQLWARANHSQIWQEWLHAEARIFCIWLQEKHPDVWREYISDRTQVLLGRQLTL